MEMSGWLSFLGGYGDAHTLHARPGLTTNGQQRTYTTRGPHTEQQQSTATSTRARTHLRDGPLVGDALLLGGLLHLGLAQGIVALGRHVRHLRLVVGWLVG